jgi:hypothetical protein
MLEIASDDDALQNTFFKGYWYWDKTAKIKKNISIFKKTFYY